jgi:hypothetical protein
MGSVTNEVVHADREDAIRRLEAAAWDERQPCPTCHDGRIPGGRKMVHCVGIFGIDLPVESVIEDIRRADAVWWDHHWLDHDLFVTVDGKTHAYEVPHPDKDNRS